MKASVMLFSDVLATLEGANYLLCPDIYVGKFLHLEMIISALEVVLSVSFSFVLFKLVTVQLTTHLACY